MILQVRSWPNQQCHSTEGNS